MGLDLVEFFMEVETRFGIDVPDADAAELRTARALIDYLLPRLNARPVAIPCRTQHTFYQLRSAIVDTGTAPREAVVLDARLDALLPTRAARRVFWSRLGGFGWWSRRRLRTVRDAVGAITRTMPLLTPTRDRRWTRDAIKSGVYEIAWMELGVRDFSEDADWVRDLGAD